MAKLGSEAVHNCFSNFLCTNACYVEHVGFPIAYSDAADNAKINESSKGLILSVFYYGYVISQIPGGWAAQRSITWTIVCASLSLGSPALGRDGFAVNHMDVAPKYAGIVMGVSYTAGTVAGIVGVWLTGLMLETSQKESEDLTSFEGWKLVFLVQGFLCIFRSVIYSAFSTGEGFFE